ncbi:hypothetical protein CTI12_AA089420 [Artemisia annua]|uniref:Ankyrin repeat-containing protein n=1 Tax=Artemisia annua TaxID=35608 RepID=A0A2U1PYR0_ARTAN|nr:hypothetical protein CTI12_AA089420 [Artemisia annua]
MGYDQRKCVSLLYRGDELCSSREIPMPSTTIQKAKQTNTNLDTDKTGELQKFLDHKNKSGQTALDVAIENDIFDVVKAFATVRWRMYLGRN